MRYLLPYARQGQVIGLLGGSFDPAHDGHVLITTSALKRFGLDEVWWLVTPGNPLKPVGPAPMKRRLGYARYVMQHPRVKITNIESHLQTRYTAQTLRKLKHHYRGVTFVWLMGADNLAQFDQWRDWHEIMATTKIGVMARPGERVAAKMSKAAKIFAKRRISSRASQTLTRREGNTQNKAGKWCFINVPMSGSSSSKIRQKGTWG